MQYILNAGKNISIIGTLKIYWPDWRNTQTVYSIQTVARYPKRMQIPYALLPINDKSP